MKFLDKGILDVLVPVEINGNEEFIIGSPNISNEQVQEYLDRLNEFYETKMYELYEKVNEETSEIIGEFTPKKDEKIIRIVPISPTKTVNPEPSSLPFGILKSFISCSLVSSNNLKFLIESLEININITSIQIIFLIFFYHSKLHLYVE